MGKRGPQKGEKYGGRQKGTPNKTTVAAKEAMQAAFEAIGGSKAFATWAKDEKNQTDFYKLYSKLLPLEVKNTGEVELIHSYSVPLTRKIAP